MLTNIKSECDVQLLKSPPLARQIIFFPEKFTSLSKMRFNIEHSCHTVITLNRDDGCRYN